MESCDICGNLYDKAFRVVCADGSIGVFDCFECAIQRFAPVCFNCQCRVIGHGVEAAGVIFCCAHCARTCSSDAVDESSRESFPASDPPAHAPSTIAASTRMQHVLRRGT